MAHKDKHNHTVVVEIDGKKWVIHKQKDKDKPDVIAFGDDFNTFLPCDPPVIQGSECPHGYTEECINNEVWCILNPG